MSDLNNHYATDVLTAADIGEQPDLFEVGTSSGQSISRAPMLAAKTTYGNRLISKFHDRYEIDSETGCWNWTAGCFTRGYGAIVYGKYNPGYAHRFSYEIHYGEIPEGAVILHECDNVKCVNPDHLRAGTQKENIHDAVNKGRWMTDKRKEFLRNCPQNFRNGQPENRGAPYSRNPKQR